MKTQTSELAPWATTLEQQRMAMLETRYDSSDPDVIKAEVQRAQEKHHSRLTSGLILYAGTNLTSPAVTAAHDPNISTRPAMGWPGGKMQPGTQELEELEVLAMSQVARSFGAQFAEVRFLTGTMANLAVYTAFCAPGDNVAVISPQAGGHASHHEHGCAGIRGMNIHYLPYDSDQLDIDFAKLNAFLEVVSPKLIMIGGSVALFPHDVKKLRRAADNIGAILVYDASHTAGLIAAAELPNPLTQGVHVVTFSTYKTYGGPAGGAAVTNDSNLAERISHAAYPVLTSNYDPARLGPLAIAAAEARRQNPAWARQTVDSAQTLAAHFDRYGLDVLAGNRGYTTSHQVVLDVAAIGQADLLVERLERHGIYANTCLLPRQQTGEEPTGIRFGTQEIVRQGADRHHMPAIAKVISESLRNELPDDDILSDVATIRRSFGSDLWGRTIE